MFGRNLGEARFRNPTKHLGRVQQACPCRFQITHSSGSWLIHLALSKAEGLKDDRLKVDQIETLELQNVHFAYPARPEIQVLQGISLTINKVGSTCHVPLQSFAIEIPIHASQPPF